MRWRVEENGCWTWLGYVGKRGRPYVSNRGPASRAVWEKLRGPIPEGLELDHLCRNKMCVNPDHLEPVTKLEHIRRAVAAGAYAKHRREKCKWGHPFNGENLTVSPNGKRRCKACQREAKRTQRAA